MNPELRIVTQILLHELWNDHGVVRADMVRDLSSSDIIELFRVGRVRFVIADIGRRLQWVSPAVCYDFWKSEAKMHIAEPNVELYLQDYPDEYCYFASEWRADDGKPIVVLSKWH